MKRFLAALGLFLLLAAPAFGTVSSTGSQAVYTGNATTTAFSFPYAYFQASDLAVTLFNTTTNATVSPAPVLNGGATYDYSVAGVSAFSYPVNNVTEYASATITFNTAPPANYQVNLTRAVPATQNLNELDNAKNPASSRNAAFDRATMVAQQAVNAQNNSLRFPITDPPTLNAILPAAAQRAGQFAGFDANGQAIAVPGTGFTADLGGYTATAAGAPTATTLAKRFANEISAIADEGAIGDGTHDDTAAVQASFNAAIAANVPVRFPYAHYKITAPIVVDYHAIAGTGLRIVSDGAIFDATSIASGIPLLIECGGGSPGTPAACFYLRLEGNLFVNANVNGPAVEIGKSDDSDAHNALSINQLIVNNGNTGALAEGIAIYSTVFSDVFAVGDAAGKAGLEMQRSAGNFIRGGYTGSGPGNIGCGILLDGSGAENGNVFAQVTMEQSTLANLCIESNSVFGNTFLAADFQDNQAGSVQINATAGSSNQLVNPSFNGTAGRAATNAIGIRVSGPCNVNAGTSGGVAYIGCFVQPSSGSITLTALDDQEWIDSNNAGGTLAVTLADVSTTPAASGPTYGFVTDNGHGITVTPAAGNIKYAGQTLTSLSLPATNYEVARLWWDGAHWRLINASPDVLAANGLGASGVVLSGSSSGATTLRASAAASGTLTLPAATDTLTGRATADTLSNKTLSSPIVNGPAGLLFSAAAPTISSGFGTGPAVAASNGPAAFTVNVGTGGAASSGVVGLPAAAHGWACTATDVTTQSASVFMTKQTATGTATATFTNYNTAGAATAWAASDVLLLRCEGY